MAARSGRGYRGTMLSRAGIIITLVGGLAAAVLPCREARAEDPRDTGVVADRLGREVEDVALVGGASLRAYPYAFYTPETSLAFGAGGTLTWKDTQRGPDQRPNSALLAVTYTTRSQLIVALDPEYTTPNGKWLLDSYFGYKKYPDKYWGIGPETPAEAEEELEPRILDIQLGAQRSLGGPWLAGPELVFLKYDPREYEPDGSLASGEVDGADGGLSAGLGATVSYDTRSRRFSPDSGLYAQASLRFFDPALGSDHSFEQLILDVRHYRTLRPGLVLALQGWTHSSGGTPPFNMLAQLGGSSLLRGYWTGRYRDRQAVVVQAEARFAIRGRLGGAAFAGAGTVADAFGDLRLDTLRPSLGGGLRWVFDRDANLKLRLDMGFGQDGQSGVYATVMEAF
jgi:hypothetical protein